MHALMLALMVIASSYWNPPSVELERAETPRRWSWAVCAGPGASLHDTKAVFVGALARYGVSDRLQLWAKCQVPAVKHGYDDHWTDLRAGAKLNLWQNGALLVSAGTPAVAAEYFHDFGPRWSVGVGASLFGTILNAAWLSPTFGKWQGSLGAGVLVPTWNDPWSHERRGKASLGISIGQSALLDEPGEVPQGWVTAAEWGGALIGAAPFGAFGLALAGYGGSYDPDQLGGVILLVPLAVTAPFTTAAGTSLAGGAFHQGGSYWASLGGAAAGTVIALPLVLGAFMIPREIPDFGTLGTMVVKFGVGGLGVLAVPTGAVLGYNLSRPKANGQSSLESRLEPPSLALRRDRLPDGTMVNAYKATFLTARF